MDVAVSTKVFARSGIGRFISDCEGAGERTISRAIEEGMQMSKAIAPVGTKVDRRTDTLREGMFNQMTGRTSGFWGCRARHALPIELGAVPHDIPADVHFYWEKMGRMWMTPAQYLARTGFPGADPIRHPGNKPHPYLRPAYDFIKGRVMQIAREEYP